STCVGGTRFNDTASPTSYWASTNSSNYGSALGYIPELVWNESASAGGSGLWASGGGASTVYTKPVWQTGAGVPADGRRDVPDVSLNAAIHDAYLFVQGGQLYLVGGTSAAAPTMAGILSMAVQRKGAPLGNANPTFYGLAANQANGGAAVFHDVTGGNNSVPGVAGFSAGAGYDLATGLGSVDALQLVNHWSDSTNPTAPGFQFNAGASSATVAPGSSAGFQVSVAVTNGFSSTVSLSTGTLPTGVTAQFTPASFAAPGSGSSNLTFAAAVNAPTGTFTVALLASGGGVSHSIPVSVTVQSSCSYSINPTSATPTAAGGNFSATVTTTPGCTWSASSTVSWIAVVNGASGNGSGTVAYSVQSNSSASLRSGVLSIAGQSLTVTQSGTVPPLSPASATYPAAGGQGTITVTLPSNGTWTASSNSNWITITGGSSSNGGNNTVKYSVAANTGVARSGSLTIGGLLFPISQSATTCSYSVTLGNMLATSGGFSGSAKVTTGAACSWNASSNVAWITVTSGSSVTGSGTANFFVANNPKSTVRSGNLVVAGYTVQITEGPKSAIKVGKPTR
ncbi:MAG TPA: BACON domain-containing carbohydrate-binding protein, partial [Bryobacteraceae bacterium]|nr:BACON domain-containing carbohydrate-binding protein [Bryobacteraceae bacterium]